MGTQITYPSAGARKNWDKHGERVSVLDYMVAVPDFASAMNAAITHAGRGASTYQGIRAGISIQMPSGAYTVNSPILVNQSNILIYGEGSQATVITRGANMPAGKGVFHITASNIKFRDFGTEGAVTTSVGLQYSTIAFDPMNALLTENTTFWVQGNALVPVTDIVFENIMIQHTGGYAILWDCTTGNISRVRAERCVCRNNRPHRFGFSSGDLNYGSWTGGFHYQGDGNLYGLTDLLVSHCSFERVTGNCVWGHLYAFNALHHNIKVKGCSFLDCGLDGVLMGGVSGGIVEGCTFRRIGYMTSDDTSQSVPKLLPNANAVAMDTSGFCMGVNYVNNTSISANGGHLDLDGFTQGTVVGNTCRTPRITDPEYTEDQIGASGWGGSAFAGGPNFAYGVNTGNSSRNQGGEGVTVVGNKFINLCGGSIRLYAGRDCDVYDNDVYAPANSLVAPIVMGNTDTVDNRRSFGNVVHGNRIDYSPASGGGVAAAIYEDGSFAAFQPTDSNWVYGNHLTGDGSAVEFQKNSVTSSLAKTVHPSLLSSTGAFLSSSFQPSSHFVQREGRGQDFSSALRWYLVEGNTSPVLNMQLQGYRAVGVQEPLLNVSSAGALGTGVYATGNRTQAVFGDCIVTGKGYFDSMLCLTDTTYVSGDQILLPSTVAVLRYISSTGALQTSFAAPFGSPQVFSQLAGESTLIRGAINVAGTAVTWVSGLKFSAWDAGTVMIVNGAAHAIASVTDDTHLVLATSATATGANWNLQSPLFNVSANGGAYTGTITTGNRGTSAFDDSMVTGKLYADSLWCLANGTYTDDDANYLPASVGLLRYKLVSGLYQFQISTTVTSGVRDWLALSGAGTPAGPNEAIQFNDIGAFGGDGNLIWDKIGQAVTITGTANSAQGLIVHTGYADVSGGYYTGINSYQAIQAPHGGVTSASVTIASTSSFGAYFHFGPTIYANFPTVVAGDTFTAGVDVLLWVSGLNGTVSPVTSYALNCNAAINAANGFATSGSATNIIQAPLGGINGRWLIATDSIFMTELGSAPPLSGAGQVRIYFSTSGQMYFSANTGPYNLLGSPAGPNEAIQFNNVGAFGGSGNFYWDDPAQCMTIKGVVATQGIIVHDAYVTVDGGYHTSSNSYQAIQAPTGGLSSASVTISSTSSFGAYLHFGPTIYGNFPIVVAGDTFTAGTDVLLWVSGTNATVAPVTSYSLNCNAAINAANGFATGGTNTNIIQAPFGGVSGRWLIATDSIFMTELSSAPPLSGSGQVRIYFSTSGQMFFSANTGPYNLLGSPAGPNEAVQFNNVGAFGGSGNFYWDNPFRALTIIGATGTFGLHVQTAFIQSDEGFFTGSLSYQALKAPSGGLLASAGTLFSTSSSGGGYLDFVTIAYGNFPVGLAGQPTFGTNDVLLWASGLNSTVSPLVSVSLNCNAAINAANGFATGGTNTNIIQAPNGGVSGKWLIATDSIFMTELGSAPALSGAGQVRIYFSTAGVMFFSANAGAYHPLGSPAGSNTQIQFNTLTGGQNIFDADPLFTYDRTVPLMTVPNVTATGRILSQGTMVLGTAIGTPAIAGASFAKWYYDGTVIKMSFNTGSYFTFGTPGGANEYIQFRDVDGSFGGDAHFIWDKAGQAVTITGISSATQGLIVVNSYITADGGLHTSNTNTDAIQAPFGGVKARWLIATDSLFFIEETAPAVSVAGQSRIYMDSGNHKLWISMNGGTYAPFNAPPGNNEYIIYNDTNNFGADANFIWDKVAQCMTINGIGNTQGIIVNNAYITAGGGLHTANTNTDAIQAPFGGVSSRWSTVSDSLFFLAQATPALSGANQARLFLQNSVPQALKVSINGGAYVGLAFVAGSNQQVQFNDNGVLGGDTGLTYDKTPGTSLLTVVNENITGRLLINGSEVLQFISAPALPASGFAKFYYDGTVVRISYNGSAYIPFGAPGGTNENVQFKDTDGSFAGTTNFIYDKVGQAVTVNGLGVASQTIIVNSGYVLSAGGFSTPSASDTAIQALLGGISGRRQIATFDIVHTGVTTGGAPVGASGQGKIYYDASLGKWRVLEGTNAPVNMLSGGGTPAGLINQLQYNSGSGTFAASSAFTVDPTNVLFTVSGVGTATIISEALDVNNNQPFIVPAIVGRKISGTVGAYQNTFSGSFLFSFAARGCLTSGPQSTATAKINVMATENWSSFGNGSEMQFVTTPNGSTINQTALYVRNTGTVEIMFGFYAHNGLLTDQGLYAKTFGTGATPNTPSSGYATFGHRFGSTWWIYNPSTSSYFSFDFLAGSGVSSINGFPGAWTINGSAPVSISTVGTTLTIALSNTVAFTSTGNAFTANAGNSFEGPQVFKFSINTGNTYTINANSGIFAGTTKLLVGGNITSGPSGAVSPGVYCGPGILMQQGCLASGYNIYAGLGGGGWQVWFGAGNTSVAYQLVVGSDSYGFVGGLLVTKNGVFIAGTTTITAPF